MISFREYICPKCDYRAWAMDNLFIVKCRKCGTTVETKEQEKGTGQSCFMNVKKTKEI